MSNKFLKKKKINKLTLVLGIIALILALVTVCLIITILGMRDREDPQLNYDMVPGQTDMQIAPTNGNTEVPGTETPEANPTSGQEAERPTQQPDETKPNTDETKPNTDETKPNTDETKPNTTETQPPVEIVERTDADYEWWLAAAMVMGVSMEYPDFELEGIYIASETTIEDKMDSAGAYVVFKSGGKTMAVHSMPLTGERGAAGTRDLSTETLGFSTFESVDPKSVNTASMKKLRIDDLGDLIAQSLLVSVYIH